MGNGASAARHTVRPSGAITHRVDWNGEMTKEMENDAMVRSMKIDQALLQDKRSQSKLVKLLLLGGSESGKSTFIKQMKIIHLKGFSESDLINYRYIIHANAVLALTQILNAMRNLGINPKGISQNVIDNFGVIASCKTLYLLTPEIGQMMRRMWTSEEAQMCFQRRHEFELMDSSKYMLDNIERLSSRNYKPTHQDILRCRTPTTGIYEINFPYKGYEFKLLDVGGQKTERRKWIHCFDDVTTVMFICSIADYDQCLSEDKLMNRLHDSLALFKYILSNNAFAKSSVLLFLNKKDIFVDKIAKIPLQICFSEYTGQNTCEMASEYILDQFVKRKPADKPIYSHFTVATDTKNIELVFAASIDTILMKILSKLNVF